jgi:membrane associated rhomboid family serine protease
MNATPYPRITPWVGRLIIANAVVMLLLLTLFTSPELVGALKFDPALAIRRPWTFLTYTFVHGGLMHLVGNMLLLFFLGSAVETRMGSRAFILYYLYCGIGAAVLALGLSGLIPVHPFIGASGAVLGVALAYAMFWPDAELILFPLPIPLSTYSVLCTSPTARSHTWPTWAGCCSATSSSASRPYPAAGVLPRCVRSSGW